MPENGNTLPNRVDRIEQLMEVLLTRHLEFEDEHKKLLTAQVLLADAQRKTEESLRKTEESLRSFTEHTGERLSALIAVVDGIVRGKPPAA